MAIWIRPSGTEIELDDKFDPVPLKALGWKKKRAPRQPQEQPQEIIQDELLGDTDG